MKAGVLAVAAALSGVTAGAHHAARRHAHEAFHLERGLYLTTASAPEPTCGCTTIYTTITGEGTLYFAPPAATYAAAPPANTSTPAPVYPTSSPAPVVPTPLVLTYPTPGVYTIAAATITLTESTTVIAAASTYVPSGSYTAGGVTTVVSTQTSIVVPYPTTSSSEGVVTSTILTTTYVCPSAGTYTVAPLTTSVSTETLWVYPTLASYAPGTYTQAETVTTITKTNYVVFCPFTSPAPPAPPAPTYVAAPAPTYVAPKPAAPKPAAPKPKPAPPSGGHLGSSGKLWAITYSPYENNGQCKEAGDVASDVATIAKSGFTTIRVYSTDCSGLQNIGSAAEAHGLKLILGIFISETGTSGAQQQVTDIISWGKWYLVELVVIGNEAVFSGYTSAGELAAFISSCKSAFAGAGYTGPSTTTEPLNVWQESAGALCGAVDLVGCNIHPFFNADVDASSAGSFTASQLKIVDGLCPGKYGLNLETGWPSGGSCNGAACPGPSEQAIAVKGIVEEVGSKSVMFSFTNDYWKEPGAFGCEQSWGSIQLFGDGGY